MEVEQLAIPKKKAMEEYEAYKKELQYVKTTFNKDMLSLYAHMKHGGKVIDLWEAMKLAGLNKDGDPRLAIVRADSKKVQFEKKWTWLNWDTRSITSNGGVYCRFRNEASRWDSLREDVKIPKGFFPEWQIDDKKNVIHEKIETSTPIVPAKIMNPLRSHKFESYHILWEVDEWKPVPPRDPMLLKRITPNMFLVLATWDLTELERAVIRGRI